MGADTITQGPPAPNQLVGTEGLVLDAKNNILYTFGNTQAAVPLLKAAGPLPLTSQVTATSATGGAATALPADPVGYLEVQINGTTFKIAYYAV
jgi:hypothetical protein